jgi:hypothetical protein
MLHLSGHIFILYKQFRPLELNLNPLSSRYWVFVPVIATDWKEYKVHIKMANVDIASQ